MNAEKKRKKKVALVSIFLDIYLSKSLMAFIVGDDCNRIFKKRTEDH